VILGPTASGKTAVACAVAAAFGGEIISADSRQVYRKLDIGTGKDLHHYTLDGKEISYHLVDIRDPADQYYLHDFIRDSRKALEGIIARGSLPVICGGTGLYLDSLRKDMRNTLIPELPELRKELQNREKEALIREILSYPEEFSKHADLSSRKRIIRAIEIAEFFRKGGVLPSQAESPFRPLYIGIHADTELRKQLIRERLKERLQNGLTQEAKELEKDGLSLERMKFLGLEYKWLAAWLAASVDLTELEERLGTEIIQFSKRQMTWFRKMEREGVKIHWIGSGDINAAVALVKEHINDFPPL
jgi:tRNA dimethylallyltransferase